jgi:uncharacterized cupin superfamily protein
MAGRVKHPLGDPFGLRSFGVDLTKLAPGAVSALRHAHTGRTNSSTCWKASRR